MAKKPTPKQLKKKLWELCRKVMDTRYQAECYTCGRKIEGSNKQLGHLIPSGTCGALLRYHLDNLRWQCYNCNINLGGNSAEFYRRMEAEKGTVFMNYLFSLKNQSVKADEIFYQKLIKEYEELLK